MLQFSGKIYRRVATTSVLLVVVAAGCQSPGGTAYDGTIPPIAASSVPLRLPDRTKGSPTAHTRVAPPPSDRVSGNDRRIPSSPIRVRPNSSRLITAEASESPVRKRRDTILPASHSKETPILLVGDSDLPQFDATFGEDSKPKSPKVIADDKIADDKTVPPLRTTATRVAELGLTQVLALAGAENWTVQLADERIRAAQARYEAAKVLWLPSLNAAIGYSKHDGRIQDTRGDVIDVRRNSLFVGGGGVTANAPTAAGSGGPARMFVDLSLADAIFKPRSTRHLLNASRWARHATFNDTLLEASLAYYEVMRAQQQLVLAGENLDLIKSLLKDTKTFEASGKGTKADVSRVDVQVERRKQDVVRADLALQLASAELARVLRINLEGVTGGVAIYATDEFLVPVDFISADLPLNELTAMAVVSRPEIGTTSSLTEAARQNELAEQWRPWIPSLHVGLSAGGFGGGTGGNLKSFSGRSDFDLLAVWQVRNLGFGTRAMRREAASKRRQANLAFHRVRDRIIADVAKAYAEVTSQKRQIALAKQRVEKALDAHKRSKARIKGFVGVPLEALQDVQAVISAQQALVNALVDYNQAQLKLLRSVGRTAAE